MKFENQIEKWLEEKVITQEQAQRMLADVKQGQEENRSSRLIVAASTLGSILLGIGAILFFAANWNSMSDFIKVILALLATFASYALGYTLAYSKENFPKVGKALLFLGSLLFGATIFLVAQIYNINANASWLVLLWLVGILPLVYTLRSAPIAGLSTVLFYIWILLLFSEIGRRLDEVTALAYLLLTGVLLFGIGAFHYASQSLKSVARTYRILSLKVVLFTAFLYTFDTFSRYRSAEVGPDVAILAIVALIVVIINLFFNISKKETNLYESIASIVLILATLLLVYAPASTVYVILFNLLFAGIIGLLIYIGYQKEDMTLVNMGLFWFAILVIARYFDWFWEMLPTSAFFMVGGLILVLGGLALEKKRRELKSSFGE